jgi:hypothetical protein
MPNPTPSDLHVNALLTEMALNWMQEDTGWAAEAFFPVVGVQKMSDRYVVYDRADFYRDEAKPRAPASESAGGNYTLDNTPTYSCMEWAFHKDVAEQDRANADVQVDPDEAAARYVTLKMQIARERNFAAHAFGLGIWGGTDQQGVAGVPAANQFLQWNDSASTPITELRAAIRAIALTGYRRQIVVGVGYDVWNILQDHPDLLARIQYGGGPGNPTIVTPQMLAQVLGVQRVVVADAVYNAAAKGATEDLQFIYGKACLVAYVTPTPSRETPSAGYTFAWTGYAGANAYGVRIDTLEAPLLKATRVEGTQAFDIKVTAPELGRYFYNCVA